MAKILYVDKVDVKTASVPEKNKVVAANMNEIKTVVNGLDDDLAALSTTVIGKQATLVSGTNIKSINGTSLLASGDLVITPNATHSGDVAGSGVLTLQPTAITGKAAAAALTGTETVLIEQSGALVKSTSQAIADLGGGDSLYTADGTLTGARVVTMGANPLSFEGNTVTVKGLGSTNATNGLIVKNALNQTCLTVTDSGDMFSGNSTFDTAQFSGYITTRGAKLTHLGSNVHTFRADNNNANRGCAVFTSLGGATLLSVGTTSVGVNRDAGGSEVGLAVKCRGTSERSKTWLGTDSFNVETSGITVNGKLGLGVWGAGRLSTSFVNSAGWVNIPAGTTAHPQFHLEIGVAPTTPNNGAIWFDGTDLKMRVGGVTKTFTLV